MAILIVDDDARTRETLRQQLHGLGHKTVIEARDSAEALRAVSSNPLRFHMIVADLEMPLVDGRKLTERLALNPALRHCPILLTSSDASARELRQAVAALPRIDACLPKPFRASALRRALALAFRRRASLRDRIILYSA